MPGQASCQEESGPVPPTMHLVPPLHDFHYPQVCGAMDGSNQDSAPTENTTQAVMHTMSARLDWHINIMR